MKALLNSPKEQSIIEAAHLSLLKRDEGLDLGRVKCEGLGLYVAEDRRAVVPVDGMCRGDKREGRGNDLARDAQSLHPHLERNHAIREKRDVLYA